MFKSFWASQEQRAQKRPHKKATNSSTPPRPVTNGPSTSSSFSMTQPTDRSNSLSNVSPAEAAEIVSILEDKRQAIYRINFPLEI
ncbi:hypothetical protein BUALT_Bualt11G0105300 [Buddleja alternifolia]|uniref:Uncharacterized protein n=1 Tax=Buddleja alternifolia TaxID=168488 RepID=A0AAV6X4V8_9LAMI|nr:hypothetical protein BUALT_Bualt11G0105300 [Buddleja alternifolia]